MIPVPESNEPRRLPPEFLPFGPTAVSRLDSALLPRDTPDIAALLRFKSLMASAGEPVELARLCRDRRYTYERIAAAHASASEELRRLALELFQIHHRRPPGLPAQ